MRKGAETRGQRLSLGRGCQRPKKQRQPLCGREMNRHTLVAACTAEMGKQGPWGWLSPLLQLLPALPAPELALTRVLVEGEEGG